MKVIDRFNYLVGGYYGVKSIDNYPRRLYILKDIENYIKDYIHDNYEDNRDYKSEAEKIEKETSLKEKLQDSLILLNEMDGPIDLVLLIKLKVKELKYHN